MLLGGRGGEGAWGVARAHTPLEQLLDEIKFQRRKELRSFSQVCLRIKGTVARDFQPPFFHQSNPPGLRVTA
jgi:hypothetical protein